MIDIVVPVLGRPQNVQPLMDSLRETLTVPDVSLIFICTEDDDAQIDACMNSGARILVIKGGYGEYPRKINYGFSHTDRQFMLMGADDVEFSTGWDVEALRVAKRTKAGVIGTNDMANESVMEGKFSTHPLIRRTYINEYGGTLTDGPGVVLHEGYDHNYVDLELCQVAQSRGQWAFAEKAKIVHHHPGMLRQDRDATYKKGFRMFGRDRQRYLRREKQFSVRSR